MRITLGVGEGVMRAMRGDPSDRPALQSEHAYHGYRVFEQARNAKTTMRQQSVKTQTNADPSGKIIEKQGDA